MAPESTQKPSEKVNGTQMESLIMEVEEDSKESDNQNVNEDEKYTTINVR